MDNSLFTDEPLPQEDLFTDEPAPQPWSVMGAAKNVGNNLKDIGTDLGNFAGKALTQNPVKTAMELAVGIPESGYNELKRLGIEKILPNSNPNKPFDPIGAGKQFGEALYEKPVTTVLDVLPALGAARKAIGIGGKAVKGMGVAAEASKAGETASLVDDAARVAAPAVDDFARTAAGAPEALNLGDEAAQIMKEAPKVPEPPIAPPAASSVEKTGSLKGLADEIAAKVPEKAKGALGEVGDFLSKKYDKVAAQPHWSDTVSKYMDEFANNATLKDLGASRGQFMNLGEEAAGELAKFARDRNISGPLVGSIGMGEKIKALDTASGDMIGTIRKVATQRGARYGAEEIMTRVKSALDDKYLKGAESGQKGTYLKALSEIQRAEPTAQGLAKAATKLNKVANDTKALKQAHGAFTDVANEVSRFNNERIAKFLDPRELKEYQNSLAEMGAAKKLRQFFKRKQAGGVGRLGPGAGVFRHLVQKGLDEFGYKFGAKVADGLSGFIKKNPGKAGNPSALFQEFINQVEDVWDDIGDPQ